MVLLLSVPGFAQTGTVTGVVADDINDALTGVTVSVEGTGKGTSTQLDGSYAISLPEGSYTITFNYVSFETKKITDVSIKNNQITTLNVVLQPVKDKKTLNEVVVTATYKQASVEGLYSRQKNSSAISDGISADQIRKTPDNNAAQVLKRVSGLTIQDNKFVTVRGMSERYNNVMLNNSMLPSTEPNRRNFSFDILPSSLIDNVVVSKTATPDMPAEFAGGVVQVQTKDIPENNSLTIGIGTGFNTQTAGRPFVSLKRDGKEFLGSAGDSRNWWRGKWDDGHYKNLYANGTGDYGQITKYSRVIPNNWGLYAYEYNPLQQYQLVAGRVARLKNEGKLGMTIAATYRHEEYNASETRARISSFNLSGNMYEFTTTAAGIANVAYQDRRHKISFRNLYTRRLSHTTQVLEGIESNALPVSAYTDIITLNNMYQNKLEGEHSLTNRRLKLGWNVDRSHVTRSQPDMRNAIKQNNRYGLGEAQGFFDITTGGLSVMNAWLEETRWNYGAYLLIPFKLFGQEQKVKVGYASTQRDADFTFSGLKMLMTPDSKVGNEVEDRPDFFIADPSFLRADGLYYRPAGPSANNDAEAYTGRQQLNAAYAMLDIKYNKWRAVGGARWEGNTMNVYTVSYAYDEFDRAVVKNETKTYTSINILPSMNIVYSLNERMNLRAAYSKTLARPDFRERSSFVYYDFNEYTAYFGIKGLTDTKTDNIDLRYEFYPGSGEVISASLFYKKFTDPVELVQQEGSAGVVNLYFNLASSTNYGIEADFRKSLSFLDRGSSLLSRFMLSGNFSYMISEVNYDIQRLTDVANGVNPDTLASRNYDDNDRRRKRPLQGLSPYIINGGLGYEHGRFAAQVSYNRMGNRLVFGAPNDFLDQYENARDVIDLQINGKFWNKRLDVRLNISDLLQQPFVIYQNAYTPDGNTVVPNDDSKGTNYNKEKDIVRQKTYRGSNISITIGLQL